MSEKARESYCDPLKCLGSFCIINFFLFGLCASGYWNLNNTMQEVLKVASSNNTQINVNTKRLDILEQTSRDSYKLIRESK